MPDSLFTKIIKGEIPAYKIYEDDTVFAFLDIHPICPGHVLVVPKKQVETWLELDDEAYIELMQAVKKIGAHLKDTLSVPYVGLKVVGVDVPHAHVHVIPFHTVAEFNHPQDMASEPDQQALAAMARKLAIN